MDVVVVASRFNPDTGYVGERLTELGGNLRTVWLDKPETLHDAETRADLLLLMATGWSMLDPAWSREIAAEKALIRRALDRGVPMLAICFGAQVVASVLGSPVAPCSKPEIGWVSVDTDDAVICAPGPWFVFHRDMWIEKLQDPQVIPIARSQLHPQAFRYGRTLAVQFHPEATDDIIDRWVSEEPARVAAAGVDVDELRAQSRSLAASARERGRNLVDTFLERIA